MVDDAVDRDGGGTLGPPHTAGHRRAQKANKKDAKEHGGVVAGDVDGVAGRGRRAGEHVATNERKVRLLDGWQAAKRILGDDYRSDAGRKMGQASGMMSWSWVRIGQRLREWMTTAAKEEIMKRIIEDEETHGDDGTALMEAGIQLHTEQELGDEGESDAEDDSDEDEEEAVDLTKDITYLRTWEDGGARKRTAKEVAYDENETEENRQRAMEWLHETNTRGRKDKNKKGKSRATRRTPAAHARRARMTARAGTAARETARAARQPARGGGGGPA